MMTAPFRLTALEANWLLAQLKRIQDEAGNASPASQDGHHRWRAERLAEIVQYAVDRGKA